MGFAAGGSGLGGGGSGLGEGGLRSHPFSLASLLVKYGEIPVSREIAKRLEPRSYKARTSATRPKGIWSFPRMGAPYCDRQASARSLPAVIVFSNKPQGLDRRLLWAPGGRIEIFDTTSGFISDFPISPSARSIGAAYPPCLGNRAHQWGGLGHKFLHAKLAATVKIPYDGRHHQNSTFGDHSYGDQDRNSQEEGATCYRAYHYRNPHSNRAGR